MKPAGIALLCVGVAISAAYGARLSPSMREQMVMRGEAQFLAGATSAAQAAYCASVVGELDEEEAEARRIAEQDGCALEESAETEDHADAIDIGLICAGRASDGSGFEEVAASARRALDARATLDAGGLSEETRELRVAWIDAMRAEVEPAARAAVLENVPPMRRVSEWVDESGPLFGLGLLLVIIGAVFGRVAARREATREPTGKDGAPARDLGELLDELRSEVADMAERALALEEPSAEDHDALKERITDVQAEKLEPIVESGPRLQVKYGMACFADVFSPLASAERLMNRAWSALVDSHWPEAAASLERAGAALEQARKALAEASERSST